MDHVIACKWYDHRDDEDVRRCWAKSNLVPMEPRANMSKNITIPDDATLRRVGAAHWPKAWNGVPPTEEQREQMYREHYSRG